MAKKAEKNQEAEKKKIKKAIEKGDPESARIYAQNAIRNKQEALHYLRLASRMDAVASRVQSAMQMKTVTKATKPQAKPSAAPSPRRRPSA